MKSSATLRALAVRAIAAARNGEPGMHEYARRLRAQARKQDLAVLASRVGRENITVAKYREYLRAVS